MHLYTSSTHFPNRANIGWRTLRGGDAQACPKCDGGDGREGTVAAGDIDRLTANQKRKITSNPASHMSLRRPLSKAELS
jgi:hypothetical protein